ncbi:MAG: asparagine synthetase B, partial [Lachnospiraceae bacterium]|nr:asparagine synthetase B [Lachnospiraceae bacterium]
MCGICGIYNIENNKKIEEPVLDKMLKAIKHRGPDGERILTQDSFGLGFNRLSFIDLAGGMQPISNEAGDVIMICNGEIFNYRELREELILKGHSFKTSTDVETVVHLYEEYGKEFVNKLNGQFAIAIMDLRSGEMHLYRDPIGICPLFYTVFDGRFIFASEIKALLEYPGMPRKLNLKAVDQLMNFPGIVAPVTFFKGINALEGGHMLTVSRGGVKNEEYWDLYYENDEEDLGEEYYVEHLRELIKKAIARRLFAEVP